MNLNNHVIDDNDKKMFHSSGYARVANGNRIGSVANISFNQRQQIEHNRSTIGIYRRSSIGGAYGALEARRSIRPSINRAPTANKDDSLQKFNSKNQANTQRKFIEPSPKSYNPYA